MTDGMTDGLVYFGLRADARWTDLHLPPCTDALPEMSWPAAVFLTACVLTLGGLIYTLVKGFDP